MRAWWRWLGTLALWWMLVFTAQRAFFLVAGLLGGDGITWGECAAAFWHGLSTDLSATGYVLLLTALLATPLLFREMPAWRPFVRRWTLLLLGLSALLNIADIGLFAAWGAKLDRKALGYLAYPKEAMAGISLHQLLVLLAVGFAQFIVLSRALRKVNFDRPFLEGRMSARVATAVLTPALCLIAARGGLQDDPINKSWAYFSRHPVLNLAALNSVWNAMEIAVEPAQVRSNPYPFMPDHEANTLFTSARAGEQPAAVKLLKTDRPNVLIVLLESWTADVIEPLGGDSGVTPQFTRLAKDGLLFTDFYSTGFRTEQGLCALISAFPAQPKTTIMRNYGKFDRLPSLVSTLHEVGYSSTYWYAGNTDFANTRAYLEAMGFDHLHGQKDFEGKPGTDWGAFDQELFDFHLRNASRKPEPFFDILMTSTSHEPFDAPVERVFPGTDQPDLYRNTVHYTDACLGRFLDAARQQPWYANTLIVVVADHGHFLPHHTNAFSARRHRIPFLLTGGALREEFRGTTNHTVASHVDLPSLLLHQFGLDASAFPWSRDPLDPTVRHHAFWTFNEGFGIADSSQAIAYDLVGQRLLELRDSTNASDTERLRRWGKADVQVLLDQYVGFDQ